MDAAIATVDQVTVAGRLISIGSRLVSFGSRLVDIGGNLVAVGPRLVAVTKALSVVVGQRTVVPRLGRWIGHLGPPSVWTTGLIRPLSIRIDRLCVNPT
jgi:hypothetical protein